MDGERKEARSDRTAAERTKASNRGKRRTATRSGTRSGEARAKVRSSGPIVFFIALFIVALGSIQLLSTFYTYALDLSELNGLKRQEASLEARKQELENDIARWNDDAYVASQARERLGFVFPGEQVVRVLHPEAVTGEKQQDGGDADSGDSSKKTLPWYSELAYSLEQADTGNEHDDAATDNTGGDGSSSTNTGGDATGSDTGASADDTGNDNTEDNQQ